MDLVLTVFQLVILISCAWLTWVSLKACDRSHGFYLKAEAQAIALKAERDRVTVAERDTEALRRELRKLSGNFYAFKTKVEDDVDEMFEEDLPSTMERRKAGSWNALRGGPLEHALPASICDNWTAAQQEGPNSEAASCECSYCVGRRAERRALRAALVPKTVQGQAEVAKINAGKP